MKLVNKTVYFISATFSLILPAVFYNVIFKKQIKYPNPYYAVILDPITVIFTLIYVGLCFLLLAKISRPFVAYLCSAIIYALIFSFGAFSIAFDNRIEFGTTWNNIEVLKGLVLSNWYYYVLLIIGLILNFVLNFSYVKKYKKNPPT